jgi:leader peptidase (prepilin peptidase)/N-methyltransferase
VSPEMLWRVEAFWAVLVGLCVGSFLNVVIDRLPEDKSLWPRSACATCGAPITAAQNIPIVSYFALRRRCASCATPIPAVFPLVEALGGLLGWLAWARCIPDAAQLDAAHGIAWAHLLAFLALLLAGSLIDVRHRILPDQLTIYAVPVGILGAALLDVLGYHGFPHVSWREAVVGAGAGGAFLGAMAVASEFVLRKEGLGWGDVKLMMMIGAFLGAAPGGFFALLFGSLLGSIVGIVQLVITRRRSYMPMGPFLAIAAAVYALYGDSLAPLIFPGLTWTP